MNNRKISLANITESYSKMNSVLILIYHSVPSTNENSFYSNNQTEKSIFEKQLFTLSKKFNVISLDSFVESIRKRHELDCDSVIITFDDGYKDNFTVAFNLLNKYHLPATIFLTTDYIDKKALPFVDVVSYVCKELKGSGTLKKTLLRLGLINQHDEISEKIIASLINQISKLSNLNKNKVADKLLKENNLKKKDFFSIMMDWQDVREMNRGGLITFGSHSKSHSVLSTLGKVEVHNELLHSRKRIEKFIKSNVTFFSYPYGGESTFSNREIDILKKYRYSCALSWIKGVNTINSNPFRLKRVFPPHNLFQFKLKLNNYSLYDKINKSANENINYYKGV